MADFIIKKNKVELLRVPRNMISDIAHTSEGFAVTIQNGFLLTYSDMHMPSYTKELIKSVLSMGNTAEIEIEVTNYNKPAVAKL